MAVNGSKVRDDSAGYSLVQLAGVMQDFEDGYDFVRFGNREQQFTQVRLTFTSSEVGNGNANDAGNTFSGQDGGLAVRVQGEDADGELSGPIGRFDDEGITFASDGTFTFDVRDLVSGAARGDQFSLVRLGTSGDDFYAEGPASGNVYINGGRGADDITGGRGNDFLVGGAGNDILSGGAAGNDSFIGGAGDDTINGGNGDDVAIFNVSTDGADSVNLGTGNDRVNVAAAVGVAQIRLTFTNSEVGNGSATDTGARANQDGGLAVRLQAEDGTDGLTGGLSRFDDEGVTFISTVAGLTFDVRDLVSGVERGDQFQLVQLGTLGRDFIDLSGATTSNYVNSGQGDDRINGGVANDFLVGYTGNDRLIGGDGSDTFIGGVGDDTISGGFGDDVAIFNVTTDGADTVNLGEGADSVLVAAPGVTQVRLTFTSAEVGNNSVTDGDTLANQDGGFAVRLQAEDGADGLTGAVSRFDDEGITFTSTTAGMTFDVRDLVSGTQRGDQFAAVQLGTSRADTIDHSGDAANYYVNGGAGNDRITGGDGSDFLVGGAGNDQLNGGLGADSFIGGAGNDTFVFADNESNEASVIVDFTSGSDKIDLRAFGIDENAVTSVSFGPNTLVFVDTSNDGVPDIVIQLENGAQPVASDFLF